MKGKVIVPFTSIIAGNSTSHRKGEILEVQDLSWLSGGLVAPVVETGPEEKAVLPEPEKRKTGTRKKKGADHSA